MKNILLTVCVAAIIQVSTCGNQSNYSSYSKDGRSHSVIEQLFKDYTEKHEKIESLHDKYNDLTNKKGKVMAEWNQYDQFSKAYWSEVKQFIGNFDSTTQQNLSHFFDQKEAQYLTSTKDFKKEGTEMTDNQNSLNQKMEMLKLLASHHQLEAFLNDNKPNIKELEQYNTELKDLGKDLQNANTDIAKDPGLVKNLK